VAIAQQTSLDSATGRLTAASIRTLNVCTVSYHKFVGALLAVISICGGTPVHGKDVSGLFVYRHIASASRYFRARR
jgi:hypothetical protein